MNFAFSQNSYSFYNLSDEPEIKITSVANGGYKNITVNIINSLDEDILVNFPTGGFFEKTLKGEITIVISEKKSKKNISNNLTESDKKNIQKLIKKLTIKEITNLISEGKTISKKEIYNYCLKLKNEN